MKTYIGTKIVEAEPAFRLDGERVVDIHDAIPVEAAVEAGYRVVYPDGYESWSPKAVFEEAYRPADGLPFGLAIEAVKKGMKISRRGWNGRGQYVQLATAISYAGLDGKIVNPDHRAIGNRALAFVGTSGVQLGWLASQADMLAEDWEIVT